MSSTAPKEPPTASGPHPHAALSAGAGLRFSGLTQPLTRFRRRRVESTLQSRASIGGTVPEIRSANSANSTNPKMPKKIENQAIKEPSPNRSRSNSTRLSEIFSLVAAEVAMSVIRFSETRARPTDRTAPGNGITQAMVKVETGVNSFPRAQFEG